jgi:hypothetical protein
MRRWYFASAAIASLGLVVAVGFLARSSSQAQEGRTAVAAAQPASKIAVSRIDKVTVYPQNALVTREVEVPAGAGLIELTIAGMPDQIVFSTMYSEGGAGLRVLTTRFSTRQVLEDTSEERRKLEAEKDKYTVIASKIASDMTSLQKNIELLGKVETVAEKGKLSGDEVIAMAKYVMEERIAKAKDMVACQDAKRLNDIQLNFVARKMGELGRGGGKVERDAVIVVDREAGKGGTIRLNYLVASVTWRPEYKVRAGKVNEDVQVDYLANLMQHSGEDWNQAKITLSTAQPMLNASPPDLCMLQPILVTRGAPGAPPMPGSGPAPFAQAGPPMDQQKLAEKLRDQAGANYRSGSLKAQFDAAKDLNAAAAWEQDLELRQTKADIVANLKKGGKGIAGPSGTDGPSVTYHLPNKLTVPSRNDEQVIEVAKLKMAPKYYYKTVPVLNTNVYRLADLCNKSEHVLLPGEATMYQGADFVGRMPMPLVAVGEEFTAGFGVDTQLQVQRQMIDQTRSTQGGNQVLKYDYRILVSSFKSQPVQLQVWDRLPKGETESVGVVLLKSAPELSKDGIYLRESRPNNLLRWDVEVPANCNGEKAVPITYEFKMELDRQMAITGFQSR